MKRKIIRGLLIGVVIGAFLNALFSLGAFKSWQDKISDSLYVAHPAHPDIVIIGIDDKSINAIGRFPWNRSEYAKLLDKLGAESANKPYAVGIDVSFLEKSNDNDDQALGNSIKKFGPVTISGEINSDQQILTPLPVIGKDAKTGIANTIADSDGTRFARIKTTNGESSETFYSFAYQVAKDYLTSANKPSGFLNSVPARYPVMRINFIGRPGSYPTYSYSDVLNGTVDPIHFKNKIVLIGATAADLHDDQITPTSSGAAPMSGVEIQANALQTILEERFINSESSLTSLITFFAITIISSVALILLPIMPMIIAFFVILLIFIGYVIYSFDHGVIRNIIYPILGIILVSVANIGYRYFSEFRQKRYIRKAFSFYLSETVLSEILSHPDKLKLGGDRREITVLFSDIAGFTGISEKLDPEKLSHMLNQYLTEMTRIVFKYNGVLDKYIGDAVMAFWGAPIKDPDHAYLCCQAALEMQSAINEIKKDWAYLGVDFGVRIGINTGDMVVGNMGSDQRFDYTLLGDNVNLGSRLEGINKEYGTSIIISEATYKEVSDKVIARKLDTVAVKGKEKGIIIYELRGIKSHAEDWEFLKKFEAARHEYQLGNFPTSLSLFKKLSKEYPGDSPTKIYLERLRILSKEKPSKWDGVYRATSK